MKKFLTPDHYFDDLDKIENDFFDNNKIKVIFCDIDNTLVRYSEREATEYASRFIERVLSKGVKFVLISNNSDVKRGEIFLGNNEVLLLPRAAKPILSTGKMKKMLKTLALKKEDAIIFGDQIFTDVLAGRFCGMRTMLVDPLGPSLIPLFEIKRFFEKPIKKRFVKKYGKNI